MVTGIHANIAARAADEREQQGQANVTPYWRTLRAGGELNPKFPGGLANLKQRLTAEGHQIVQRGTRMFVANFEGKLAKLT